MKLKYKMARIVVGAGLISALAGCHLFAEHKDVKYQTMDMHEFEEDIVIPGVLWKEFEHMFLPQAMDPEGKAIKDSQKKKDNEGEIANFLKKKPPVENLSFKVFLEEKTKGVLGGQNFELDYPAGGGILDYRYFLPESRNGTFYMEVVYGQDMDKKLTRVFYLSNAKKMMVDDKPLGSGCGRYFNITDFWKKSMSLDGLVLNTV